MTTSADVGVIGAGVIGLAIAHRPVRAGPEVFVIERKTLPEWPTRLRASLDDENEDHGTVVVQTR